MSCRIGYMYTMAIPDVLIGNKLKFVHAVPVAYLCKMMSFAVRYQIFLKTINVIKYCVSGLLFFV